MIGYNLLLEGILSIGYFKEAFFNETGSIYAMMLVWVLYLSAKIVLYIGWDKRFFVPVGIVTTVAVAMAQSLVFGALSYFFMLCVTQMMARVRTSQFYYCILALLLFFFVPTAYQMLFVIFSVFVFIIQLVLKTNSTRIQYLQERVDEHRIRAEQLKENALALKEFDVSAKYASQLEERNRIAQKLHDELGHTLSGSTMQLEAIQLILDKDPEKAKTMLSKVTQGLREGTDEIRQILKNIKPESASLNISNIRVLASNAQERAGIKTEVIYDVHIADISQNQWQVITENIREALTNMMKHSGATKATIQFEQLNKLFKVTIKDNGRGCKLVKSGLGIAGMEERCAQLGGKMVVDGSHGFSIIMLLPIGA
ncbi:MAG: sensor histidine kinase [Eubacteriales bacterium]